MICSNFLVIKENHAKNVAGTHPWSLNQCFCNPNQKTQNLFHMPTPSPVALDESFKQRLARVMAWKAVRACRQKHGGSAWGLGSCCCFQFVLLSVFGMTQSGIIWKRAPERSISSMMHHKAIFRINPNWTPLEWLQKGQVAYGSYLMDLQWSLHILQPYCCMRLYLSSVKVLTGNTTCCFKPSSRTPKQTTSCHIQHVQFLLALVLAHGNRSTAGFSRVFCELSQRDMANKACIYKPSFPKIWWCCLHMNTYTLAVLALLVLVVGAEVAAAAALVVVVVVVAVAVVVAAVVVGAGSCRYVYSECWVNGSRD